MKMWFICNTISAGNITVRYAVIHPVVHSVIHPVSYLLELMRYEVQFQS